MGRFDKQTVLVTGGTGGQGASHVRAYHEEGANVVIAALSAERGEALAAELGERALFVRLDVTDEDAWVAAVAETERRFGPIAVLVNNAGVQNPAVPIEAVERHVWDRVLAVNLTGAFLGIKTVTPSLRRNGGGVIVNIASTMAHVGSPFYAPYVAGKWALRGLTRTAALELGRDGIRVNSLHPGVISTPFITDSVDGQPPIADFYSPEPYAIPRMGTPADITALLLHLTSAEASFVTGSEFVADGGLLLGPALKPGTTAA
ncbi:SDR family NAD(P)-dependent oxidoreductase [Nocardia sp. NRRL S-836]|uniref:SDR family NAD(P)-dependent oxidoreductase n=1 Tax=Nocardia sp. NRRL S-836 TaxID=1519492 RepID=UPI0006B062DE|nr:SDR family oxidoreductase [Nocardia sp. NRRL S-836]KOV83850.1 3-alpha-hydroxysteroid dehydrogenase [Nocardia sp. NRRL S-836]